MVAVSRLKMPQLFFQSPQINGALIGKACLNSQSFVKIAKAAALD